MYRLGAPRGPDWVLIWPGKIVSVCGYIVKMKQMKNITPYNNFLNEKNQNLFETEDIDSLNNLEASPSMQAFTDALSQLNAARTVDDVLNIFSEVDGTIDDLDAMVALYQKAIELFPEIKLTFEMLDEKPSSEATKKAIAIAKVLNNLVKKYKESGKPIKRYQGW